MISLLHDVADGLRALARRPGYTLAVALCLGLGIGANTAIFSVVDAALLRALPYPAADRLVVVHDDYRADGAETETPVSAPNFLAFRERNRVFDDLGAISHRDYTLTADGGEPEHVKGARVSRSLFALLGVRPQRGRLFSADEDRPGAPFTALLSDGLWHRRFGADTGLLGRAITVNGTAYQVVGILPPGFRFPDQVDVWAPLQLDPAHLPSWHDLEVVARLRPGRNLEQAQSDLGGIAAQLARELPDSNRGWGVKVLALRESLVGDVRPALLVLLGAVVFVLAIACANVANLQLARFAEREREVAIRMALGAGRGRLVRHFLVESLLLALAGGGLGLLLAAALLRPLVALSPVEVAAFRDLAIDRSVLAFTLATSIATGLLFGLVPALKTSRPEMSGVLRQGTRGTAGIGGRRFRGALVVAETGLALVLLVGAGLMLRSFWNMGAVDSGFDPRGVLTARLQLPGSTYPKPEQRAAFFRSLVERAAAIPGVAAAAITTTLPLAAENVTDELTIEGRPTPPGEIAMTNSRMVTPAYFRAMKIPLRAGRCFDSRDDAGAPGAVIVSESMARRFWPRQDPVGRRAKKGGVASERPWLTVVGVVGDVKDLGLAVPPGPTWYMPLAQNPWNGVNLVVRAAAAPLQLESGVRRAVRAVDRNQAVFEVVTMEQLLSGSLARPRFSALLLFSFAALALVLAVIGLYAVLSYSVRQRLREIGIRMALGAQRSHVQLLVLRQGLGLVAAGIGLGAAAALALTRLLRAQLFGIGPGDPRTYALLSLGLAAVAVAANLLPARRATKVDPVVSLKSE